jgi:hypothetical protein
VIVVIIPRRRLGGAIPQETAESEQGEGNDLFPLPDPHGRPALVEVIRTPIGSQDQPVGAVRAVRDREGPEAPPGQLEPPPPGVLPVLVVLPVPPQGGGEEADEEHQVDDQVVELVEHVSFLRLLPHSDIPCSAWVRLPQLEAKGSAGVSPRASESVAALAATVETLLLHLAHRAVPQDSNAERHDEESPTSAERHDVSIAHAASFLGRMTHCTPRTKT